VKKAVFALSILLCSLFVPSLKNYQVKANPTRTWIVDTVGEGADFRTVQEAINNASAGDTIFVRNGTYHENVVINKSITLLGEEKTSTIIDGNGTDSVIFIEDADNITVKGFTLKNSGTFLFNSSGVLIERSNGITISDNIIYTNYNGISLIYSNNTIIYDNNISKNFYTGISLYSSANTLISSNIILDNYNGISFIYSSSAVISANTIMNNSCGISLTFSSGNKI
jgi:parallel beta-helix repeat protein